MEGRGGGFHKALKLLIIKKGNRGSRISIKAHSGASTTSTTVIIPTTTNVCVCVFLFQCVGGVISLAYVATLSSLFKG